MSSDLKSNVYQIPVKAVGRSVNCQFEFGNFRLDAEHLMLYRDGEVVPITPKQAETLLALIERVGEIVSKDVLMDRLWGDAAVEESNLVQNIYILRKILGESPDGKPLIETLRRRGYRLNVEVTKIPTTRSRNGFQTGHEATPTIRFTTVGDKYDASESVPVERRDRRLVLAGIVSFVLITLLSSTFLLSWKPTIKKTRLAVLPLQPIDPHNRNTLYENGVPDALINRLRSMEEFAPQPLYAVLDYDSPIQDPIAAGREQRVEYVLASHYQIADGKIRISAELINVESGKVEEPFKFEQEVSTVFAIQDAAAARFADNLKARFNAGGGGRARMRGTTSEDAYGHYLMGMLHYKRRDTSDPRLAIQSFEQATTADANYAPAWAGLALAYRALGHKTRPDPDATYISTEAKKAIDRALEIDPNLSEAHAALCSNKFSYDWDFAAAERECKRAIELDADSSIAHEMYSFLLSSRGRHEEAIAQVKTAIDLDPTSYWNQRLYAVVLYFARRYNDAALQYRRLYSLNPKTRPTFQWMIRTQEARGDEAEAFKWFREWKIVLDNADEKTVKKYDDVFQKSGWLGVLREREKDELPGEIYLAGWAARLGNKDRAFELLEKCYQKRNYMLIQLENESQFDSLHDDPRYADLRKRIEGHRQELP